MSPPSRRDLLASSTALLPLAGCMGNEANGYRPNGTTDGTDAGSTPKPGECTAQSPPSPETGEGLPDAKSYPEHPSKLTMASVSEFLAAYEAAYTHNRMLADVAEDGNCLENLHVDVTGTSVEPAGESYRGTVEYRLSFTGSNCPGVNGTDTPTPLPSGHTRGKVTYRVADRFLVRDGVVVACW